MPADITDFPSPILANIFTCLHPEDRLMAATVCRAFHDIILTSHRAQIWKYVVLEVRFAHLGPGLAFLRSVADVAVSLGMVLTQPEASVCEQLPLFPHVKHLVIDIFSLGHVDKISDKLPLLSSIDVCSFVTNEQLARIPEKFPNLKAVTLSDNWRIFNNFLTPTMFRSTMDAFHGMDLSIGVVNIRFASGIIFDCLAKSRLAKGIRSLKVKHSRMIYAKCYMETFVALESLKCVKLDDICWLSDMSNLWNLTSLTFQECDLDYLVYSDADLPLRLTHLELRDIPKLSKKLMSIVVRKSNTLESLVIHHTHKGRDPMMLDFDLFKVVPRLIHAESSIEYLYMSGIARPASNPTCSLQRLFKKYFWEDPGTLKNVQFLQFVIMVGGEKDVKDENLVEVILNPKICAVGELEQAVLEARGGAGGKCMVRFGADDFTPAEYEFIQSLDGWERTECPAKYADGQVLTYDDF